MQPWQTRPWVTYFDALRTSQVQFHFHTFWQTKHIPSLVTYEICVVPCLVSACGPNVCTCGLMIFLSKIILLKQLSVWSFIQKKWAFQCSLPQLTTKTLNSFMLSDETRTFSQDLTDKACGLMTSQSLSAPMGRSLSDSAISDLRRRRAALSTIVNNPLTALVGGKAWNSGPMSIVWMWFNRQ